MTEPRTFTVFSQRLWLNICEWGSPDAPPLVLLHGVCDHARSWDKIAEKLANRFRVLAPDLRGHGDSEHARGGTYHTEAYVFDLAEFVAQTDLKSFVLIGHSLGGNVALRFAALFPERVRRIVAIEGLSHSPKTIEERRAKPAEQRLRDWIDRQRVLTERPPRRYPSLAEAIARFREQHPRIDRDWAEHLTRHGVRANADGTVSFKFDPTVRIFPPVEMPAEDAWRLWSLVTSPALLVYGADSWASNPLTDGRAAHFRDARVVTLSDAGHWAHHDQCAAFMAEVEGFLAD